MTSNKSPDNRKVIGIFLFLPKQPQIMKSKLFAIAIFIFLFSCAEKVASPKVTISAQKPDPVQVPPKVASANEGPMSADLAAGRMLYENNCAKCHRLFGPKEYSQENWGPILVVMQKKAHLGDADMAKITNYIYSNL
jgi:cytochrome c5